MGLKRDISCDSCGFKLEVEEWVPGECPKCQTRWDWDEYQIEDEFFEELDSCAFVIWDN
jgi:predicted Zn-ribbon and HTH transcriptional regulator